MVYANIQRTQALFSIPCRYNLLAFEKFPFLRNNSPFTKNVDSGNSLTPHPAFTTAVLVAVAVAADVATAAAAAAGGGAAGVATGAFLRFVFDFFPMMIAIQIRSGIIPGVVVDVVQYANFY